MSASFFEYLGWVSLSANLKESFNKTLADAHQHRHQMVEIEHLLHTLVDDPEGAIALAEMNVERDDLREETAERLEDLPSGGRLALEDLQPSRELKKLMAMASEQADLEHDDRIDGGDVVRALAAFEAAHVGDYLLPLQKKPASRPERRTAQGTPKPPRPRRSFKAPLFEEKPDAKEEPGTEDEYEARTSSPPPANQPPAGDSPVERTPVPSKTDQLDFEVDPIRASIKSIMARRRDAEEILYECEWYHLFKSLNLIDDALDGEDQAHRAKLLAKAEQELEDRPRCRKAFLYVRHLDQELARLKGIVDIDLVADSAPDHTVAQLDRLRTSRSVDHAAFAPRSQNPRQDQGFSVEDHLFEVKVQESEVKAMEQKLARLDRMTDSREDRIRELESHLERHDTHSKKRESVIGELERYLRSEIDLADARDRRIVELEKDLRETKGLSESQVSKASSLEQELTAFKEHAGNREMHIAELEAQLKMEKDTARSKESQALEMRELLDKERERASEHDKQVASLQSILAEEKLRAQQQEEQVHVLEANLKAEKDTARTHENELSELRALLLKEKDRAGHHDSQVTELKTVLESEKQRAAQNETQVRSLQADLNQRLEKLQAQEAEIKTLQDILSSHEQNVMGRDEEVKTLQTRLQEKEREAQHHQQETVKLTSNMGQHQQEVSAMRSQLDNLQGRLREQETSFSVEKVQLNETIEKLRKEIEESQTLIEVVRVTGEPYRLNAAHGTTLRSGAQIVSRKTIPEPAGRKR